MGNTRFTMVFEQSATTTELMNAADRAYITAHPEEAAKYGIKLDWVPSTQLDNACPWYGKNQTAAQCRKLSMIYQYL